MSSGGFTGLSSALIAITLRLGRSTMGDTVRQGEKALVNLNETGSCLIERLSPGTPGPVRRKDGGESNACLDVSALWEVAQRKRSTGELNLKAGMRVGCLSVREGVDCC